LHRRMYKAKCFDEDRIKILASLSHKNNWYRFEQEYRFVILENKKKNDSPKEFYHLENLDIKQLINSVYVSPYCKKCFCNMNCQKECCISKMINMCEINNIEIKPSTIQFQSYNPFSLAKGGE
jgi:hypothetical protein